MSNPIINGYEFERLDVTPCYRSIAHGIGIEPFCQCPACAERGAASVKAAQKARKHALTLIYRHTSRDYKGRLADGTRSILVLRNGGSTLAPLDQLTDAEIARLIPSAQRQETRRQAEKQARAAR
jgi:hypothetical protein